MVETLQENDVIKVIIVDDHTIIRDGIKALMRDNDEILIVGEASNGKELIEILPELAADVILMDINMPEMDGFETTGYMREKFPDIKVLVLSMLDHENYIAKAFDAGATGYLLKNTGREEMVCAIKIIANGGRYLCSDIGFNLQKHPQ